jgi:hypothetical protein
MRLEFSKRKESDMLTASDQTRAGAWLDAAEKLLQAKDAVYNLVVEVKQPALATAPSRAVEARVGRFLQQYSCQPLHTVADTIFPTTEYLSGGLAKVYEYPTSIYPHIKSLRANQKGTYALRLVQRKCSNGETMRPLEVAIDKLRAALRREGPMRAVYELDLGLEPLELKFYEAEQDHANQRGGQCLSHVSLKLGPDRELYLTALYRYQYFAQKALGNYLGLARLQACVAREVGVPVGPLVCHATLATFETSSGDRNGKAWGLRALGELVQDCRALMPRESARAAA